jgi:hypothetical protein
MLLLQKRAMQMDVHKIHDTARVQQLFEPKP